MAATAFRKTENASWKKVRDILAQCKEFDTLIGRTVKLASKKTDKWIKFKYTLIEKPFPETFEINPGPIDVLKEDEKAIKIQPQLNGQEEFQIF